MIAMVQRPRRKAHLASSTRDGAWLTVCDRDVAADAAVITLEDAQGTVDAQADHICVHCFRLILMAGVVAQYQAVLRLTPTPVPQPAVRLAPVTDIRRTA